MRSGRKRCRGSRGHVDIALAESNKYEWAGLALRSRERARSPPKRHKEAHLDAYRAPREQLAARQTSPVKTSAGASLRVVGLERHR